jgi:hypothetical protein
LSCFDCESYHNTANGWKVVDGGVDDAGIANPGLRIWQQPLEEQAANSRPRLSFERKLILALGRQVRDGTKNVSMALR